MSLEYFIRLANESAGTLYLMVILLFVALVIIIERWRHLAYMNSVGIKVIEMCQTVSSLSPNAFNELEQQYPQSPILKLFKVAISGEKLHLVREELDGDLRGGNHCTGST
jgi:biopolymer transport protein ExbB